MAEQNLLDVVRRLTKKLEASRDKSAALQQERDEVIRRARLDGYRVRDLAHEAGVSRQMIEKIVKAPFQNADEFV